VYTGFRALVKTGANGYFQGPITWRERVIPDKGDHDGGQDLAS